MHIHYHAQCDVSAPPCWVKSQSWQSLDCSGGLIYWTLSRISDQLHRAFHIPRQTCSSIKRYFLLPYNVKQKNIWKCSGTNMVAWVVFLENVAYGWESLVMLFTMPDKNISEKSCPVVLLVTNNFEFSRRVSISIQWVAAWMYFVRKLDTSIFYLRIQSSNFVVFQLTEVLDMFPMTEPWETHITNASEY